MRRRDPHPQISDRFAAILEAESHIERDIKYWLIHAMHWHAFLFAAICVISFGYALH